MLRIIGNWALLLGLFVVAGTVAAEGKTVGKRPRKTNLLCIVTDDQAVWSLGCYGNKESRTPHMDRLAREGALFRRAYVATPVCSPSRVSFLTGKYGTEVAITDYIAPKEAQAGVGIPVSATTFLEILRRAGYATGLIGKWHLGMLPRFHPTKHGIDHFFGFTGGGNKPMHPVLERGGKDEKFKGSLPDILTDEAIAFVKKHRDRPFALSLHFRAPHAPYAPVPKQDSAPFAKLDPSIPDYPDLNIAKVKKLTVDYYGSVHSVDRNVGRLLQVLDDLGLAEDTIVLFTSDHGYSIGHNGVWHKGNGSWITNARGGQRRPNMFANNLQVPLLVRWPRRVKGGTKIDGLVSNIDTFPTVLALLEVDPPRDYRQHGQDFSPLLRGEPYRREAVFAQYDLHNYTEARMRSVLTDRWHLVRQYHDNGQPDELFDLANDPEERRNLYADPAHRETRDRLQEMLDGWMRNVEGKESPGS